VADKARDICWYFAEVSRLNVNVGVSEVEKQAAKAKECA
jgi:hypothetical protein